MNERLKSWLLASLIAVPFCTVFFIVSESKSEDVTYGSFYNAQYVRNYDGDTVTFNIPNIHPVLGEKVSIRVRGIDTPEIRGKCQKEKDLAYEAKAVVQTVMVGAMVSEAAVLTVKEILFEPIFPKLSNHFLAFLHLFHSETMLL